MHLLDGEIAALLAGQNTDLFTQSRQAQAAFEHALQIAQDIDVQAAPPALDGLRGAACQHGLCLPRSRPPGPALGQPAAGSQPHGCGKRPGTGPAAVETLEESKWLAKRLP